MAKNTFNVDILSVSSIENLKKQLQEYKSSLQGKCDLFVKRLAELGIPIIDQRMQEASFSYNADGTISGSDPSHYTHITVTSLIGYSQAVLTVEGQDLLFIEFGAGVHYNGAVGSSPNPKGAELGYTIGSYGEGHGKQESWGYIDENTGDLVITRGTKATMPMYSASVEIIANIQRIAKDVFSK